MVSVDDINGHSWRAYRAWRVSVNAMFVAFFLVDGAFTLVSIAMALTITPLPPRRALARLLFLSRTYGFITCPCRSTSMGLGLGGLLYYG